MFLKISKNIIEEEAKALLLLSRSLDTNYNKVLSVISKANGNIILSGVGKSGHIARKIASTLTSTGTPAYFIHPTEASHGDLGSIRKKDILFLLSKSTSSCLKSLERPERIPMNARIKIRFRIIFGIFPRFLY